MGGTLHIGIDDCFDPAAFPEGVIPGKIQDPDAAAKFAQRMACPVPTVEFTCQIQLIGIGSPLAVNPASVHMMDTKIIMSVRKIIQGVSVRQKTLFGIPIQLHPVINVPGEILKLGIQFQ